MKFLNFYKKKKRKEGQVSLITCLLYLWLFFFNAYGLAAQIEKKLALADHYFQMAFESIDEEVYDQTTEYTLQMGAIYSELGAWNIYADKLNWIGYLLNAKKQYHLVISLSESQLERFLQKTETRPIRLFSCYSNLGKAYLHQNQKAKAKTYLKIGLEILVRAEGSISEHCAGFYDWAGRIYQSIGDYEEAISYYENAVQIYTSKHFQKHPKLPGVYFQLSECFQALAKDSKSNQYLQLYQQIKPDSTYIGEIRMLREQIAQARDNQQFDSLQIYVDTLRTYLLQKEDWYAYVNIFKRIGSKLITKNYPLAKAYLEEALAVGMKKLGKDHFEIALIYGFLGEYYEEYEGNYDKAIYFGERSLSLLKKITGEQCTDVGLCYNVIGLRMDYKGDYENALKYHQKALDIRLKTGVGWAIAQSYKNIGRCYEGKGDYLRAIAYYKKAKRNWLFSSDSADLTHMAHQNLGRCYNKVQQYDSAIVVLNKALHQLKKRDGHYYSYYALRSLKNLGDAYGGLENPEKQLAFYQEAAKIANQLYTNKNPDNASIYKALGDYYNNKEEYHTALQHYQKALVVLSGETLTVSIYQNPGLESVFSQIPYLQILIAKAAVLQKWYSQTKDKTQLENALSTYQLSVRLLQQVRSQFNGHQSQIVFLQSYKQVYDKGIALAFELYEWSQDQNYIEIAFNFSEQSKANALLTAYNLWNSRLRGTSDSLLLKNYQRLEGKLLFFESSVAPVTDSVLYYSQSLDSLKKQILAKYPDFYLPKFASLTLLQQHLREQYVEKTALMEFYQGERDYFQFVITESAPLFFKFPLTELSPLLDSLRQALKSPATFDYLQPAFACYQRLLGQALPQLGADHFIQRLIIVPDAELYLIPFEALIVQKPFSGSLHPNFLLENYTITYDFSATLLLEKYKMIHHKKARKKFVAFSPVFTQKQIDCQGKTLEDISVYHLMVQNLAKSYGKAFIGTKATKSFFLKAGKKYQVIFLYTHACADMDNPANNTLFFSGDKLTTSELYQHHFRADLLILCGCETALGRIDYGEGMMGLTHGFTYQGIPSTVSSLWQLNTRSSSLITRHFMQLLRRGKSKDEALRQSKLYYLQTAIDEDKHPYYWAGLVHFGNTAAMERTPKMRRLSLVFVILFLLFLGFYNWDK